MEDWNLIKGTHDLSLGFFAHLSKGPGLDLCMANMSLGSGSSSTAETPADKSTCAKDNIAAARTSTQKILDCHTFVVSLFTKDSAEICSHFRFLDSIVSRDFESMISASNNSDGARIARDFKSRLDLVTLAYEPLAKRFIKVAESDTLRFPPFAAKDAAKAEVQANALYAWARTFVPNENSNLADLDKLAKLKMMPYLVAMAYAVRVKLDVHYVEGSMLDRADRMEYLERSRNVVDEFVVLLRVAVNAILAKSSLLEVALDYHLALSTYLMLIATLRKSAQMMLAPTMSPGTVQVWEDGLSRVRAILYRGGDEDSASSTSIVLDNIKESIWWAAFADRDYESLGLSSLRTSIELHEMLFILGTGKDEDDGTAVVRLAKDYKHTLTQLEPAHLLRSDLQGKLAAALDVPQAQLVVESFASIRSGRELPPPTSSSISSGVPVVLGAPVTYQVRLSRTLTDHSNTVLGLAVTSNGERLVSGSADGTAKVWSLSTGKDLGTFSGHKNDDDNVEEVVGRPTSGLERLMQALAGRIKVVTCVALCPDGKRVVSGGSDHAVRVWNIDTGNELGQFKGHTNWVHGIAVSPDGRIVASASSDDTIKLWDINSGRNEATLLGHSDTVKSVVFSPDGQLLASGSKDATIKVWNVRSGRLERTLANGHSGAVFGLAFTPDGQRLVSTSGDNTVKVWNWRSETVEMSLMAHTDDVNCVVMFPDGGKIATGSDDNSVRIWNLHTGALEHTLTGHASFVLSLAISPDGQTLVSGSKDETIKVWELK